MKWESRSVGSMENNAYLLTSSDDHLVLVDAATEPATLLEWIGPRTLDAVITTHQHFDHIGALAAVVEATGATPWCGGPDAASIAEQTGVQCRTVWTGD
ncbi:MAG: MBL fold metallo-hydrolase, partial [Propionibacterium sp.]|nr:MBL fold metallo-hydrolase [Propionibacterium sp.]